MTNTYIVDTTDERNILVKKYLIEHGLTAYDFPITRFGLSDTTYIYVLSPIFDFSSENIECFKDNSYVYAFSIPKDLEEYFKCHHIIYRNISACPTFAEKNSYLSAEGTLHYAIESTNTILSEQNILILGYGHFGKALARVFSCFNQKLTIATRSAEKIKKAMATESKQEQTRQEQPQENTTPNLNIQSPTYSDSNSALNTQSPTYGDSNPNLNTQSPTYSDSNPNLNAQRPTHTTQNAPLEGVNLIDIPTAEANLSEYTLILNTIPAKIWQKQPRLHNDVVILELASKIYPFDYETMDTRNYRILRAIPAKTCKLSAAKLLFEVLINETNINMQ